MNSYTLKRNRTKEELLQLSYTFCHNQCGKETTKECDRKQVTCTALATFLEANKTL